MKTLLLCAALFGCAPMPGTMKPQTLIFIPPPRHVALPQRKPTVPPEAEQIERLHLEIDKANAALQQLHETDPEAPGP